MHIAVPHKKHNSTTAPPHTALAVLAYRLHTPPEYFTQSRTDQYGQLTFGDTSWTLPKASQAADLIGRVLCEITPNYPIGYETRDERWEMRFLSLREAPLQIASS